jgi:hypothetical protein
LSKPCLPADSTRITLFSTSAAGYYGFHEDEELTFFSLKPLKTFASYGGNGHFPKMLDFSSP